MSQNSLTTFLATLAMAAVVGACGDDDNGDDGACSGLQLCTVAGTSCTGDVVETCTENADGCLVATTQNCAASGEVCDDTGASAMCVADGCSDDAACAGASDGDSFCSGTTTVDCATGTDGCLDATVLDCATAGDLCDDSGAAAVCLCQDDTACVGASDGDSFCAGTDAIDCDADLDGCLVATTVDCSATSCDDSGASAVCAPSCTDHPACVGATEGDLSCDGFNLNTCSDTNADGCLDLAQQNCAPGLCDATGVTPVCGTVTATGEDCGNAIPVLASGFVYSGNITDFAGTIGPFVGAGCSATEGASIELVFSVDLLNGDTVAVSETGGMDSVMHIQTTCGAAAACDASQDDPDVGPLRYTATADGTVYITLEAYAITPSPEDFTIEIAVNPVCGNSLLEAGEACDDGDTNDGDGCAAGCTVETGWTCDTLSPTTCAPPPNLGTFGVGDAIGDVVNGTLITAGDSDYFTITFTEDVSLSGTLVATGTGDPDFYLRDSANQIVVAEADTGDEAWTGRFVPAGTYTGEVNIWAGDVDADLGYTLTLSTTALTDLGSIGDGGSISETGGPLTAGAGAVYKLTVTEDIELSGTLTGDNGSDMDMFIYGATGFVTSNADDLDETFNVALQAGTYAVVVNAWDGAADANNYTLTASAAALSVTDIGSFAAAAAIADTVGGAITARAYDHYTITFTEDVLLSGTLGGNGTGVVGLRIYDANDALVDELHTGDESFTDTLVPAGTYVVQVLTVSTAFGGGDVDAYTLALSSTAVP